MEVTNTSFKCGPITLEMVKTAGETGWLLNNKVLFSDPHQAASAFYINAKHLNQGGGIPVVTFSTTGVIVCVLASNADVIHLQHLLENPPMFRPGYHLHHYEDQQIDPDWEPAPV